MGFWWFWRFHDTNARIRLEAVPEGVKTRALRTGVGEVALGCPRDVTDLASGTRVGEVALGCPWDGTGAPPWDDQGALDS